MEGKKGTAAAAPGSGKPIRLLVNGIHARSGGGVTYIREMVPRLAAFADVEVHLFLHRDQFDLFYPTADNVRLHLFGFSKRRLPTLLWEQLAVPILARDMDADIVFSPANYGPLFARNHVILLRNAVSVRKVQSSLRGKIYWFSLGLATFVCVLAAKRAVAVSDYAKKDLTFGFGRLVDGKVPVIHHGTRFGGGNGGTPAAGRRANLLAVSDIYVQKNYHTLFRAFAILRRGYPDLTLTVAGATIDQAYLGRLQRIIDALGLTGAVRFLGRVDTEDLRHLYRSCRVFVFPSLVETFGNPLLEAMAEGAAIACSNRAAMPEVLGDAGLMFDPFDSKDMAAKIATLLDDEALSRDVGERAARRARTFTWERTVAQTRAVFDAIAAADAGRREGAR